MKGYLGRSSISVARSANMSRGVIGCLPEVFFYRLPKGNPVATMRKGQAGRRNLIGSL